MKRSKAYRAAAEKIEDGRIYSPLEAVRLVKETSATKFDATVEAALRLGVDPRKADQMVRGTVNLPHGTGKSPRVAVFATGAKAEEADGRRRRHRRQRRPRPADPGRVPGLRRHRRHPGPDGQGRPHRPHPRPPWPDAEPEDRHGHDGHRPKAVGDIKGGKVNFRVDKQANLHLVIGKASFTEEQLVENYAAALDEVMRAKPSAAKGRYLKKITFATTMGPGVPVDVNRTRGLTEDAPTV